MQGTWVQSLLREDPTCLMATKPVHRNYWSLCFHKRSPHPHWEAHARQLETSPHSPQLETSPHSPQLETSPHSPQLETSPHSPQLETSPHSPQLERACTEQRRPSTAKNKQILKKPQNTVKFKNLSCISLYVKSVVVKVARSLTDSL